MSRSLLQNALCSPHSPKFLTRRHPEAHRLHSTICFSLALSCEPSSPIAFLSSGAGAAYALSAFSARVPLLAPPVALQLWQTFWPPRQSCGPLQAPSVLPALPSHPPCPQALPHSISVHLIHRSWFYYLLYISSGWTFSPPWLSLGPICAVTPSLAHPFLTGKTFALPKHILP